MKNKHQKKQSNTVKQKAMIDSLIFQTNWGNQFFTLNPSPNVAIFATVVWLLLWALAE